MHFHKSQKKETNKHSLQECRDITMDFKLQKSAFLLCIAATHIYLFLPAVRFLRDCCVSPTWADHQLRNRQNGWWGEEMLLFYSPLKVIWGNGSFCVGEYVMQEQSKNISFCFHSNSHAGMTLNSLIHSFSSLCGLCPVCRVAKWSLHLCLQMCFCSLLWQQGTSYISRDTSLQPASTSGGLMKKRESDFLHG